MDENAFADVLGNIEKHMEGTSLGLSALAEVLTKQEARQEEAARAAQQESLQKEEEEERSALIKSIAKEVLAVMKSERGISDGGWPKIGVEGYETKPADGSNVKGDENADDSAKTINEDTSTATATRPVVSADGNSLSHDTPGGSQLSSVSMKEKNEDDDEDEEYDEYDEKDKMQKEMEDLRKELSSLKADINKSVESQVSQRLAKSGFQEANTLKAPKRVDLGAGEPLMKGDTSIENSDQLVDLLAQLPNREVARIQHNFETGNYDQVPAEILKAYGINR